MLMLLQAAVDSPMPVSTELPALISTSALSVAIIQWFKNSQLPIFKAFSQDSTGLNRTVAWLAAVIAGIGIHYHYDPALGALTITGLTIPALVSTGVNSAKSYAFNWLIYNTAIKSRAADVSAVASGMPVTPVASPGAVKAGVDQANESGGSSGKA
jgi:hypothetical protein